MMKATNGAPRLKQRLATARRARRLAAALAAVAGTILFMTAADAAPAPTGAAAVVGQKYRHGLVPMVTSGSVSAPSLKTACSSTKCLHYRGGVSGVGVTTGKELVGAEDLTADEDRTDVVANCAFFIVAAANHEPGVFPDPDRFDITRSPKGHMAFSAGHLAWQRD